MITLKETTTSSPFTGKQKRAMNRSGNVLQIARKYLDTAKSYHDCSVWFNHKNRDVRMLAYSVAFKLPTHQVIKSEFDLLVERFTAEGKKDPVKSARASIAASAKKRQLSSTEVQHTSPLQWNKAR